MTPCAGWTRRCRSWSARCDAGQDQVGFAGSGAVTVVAIGTVDQDHQVRILFQLARFAQVRQLRKFVCALFGAAVELADRDHRHVEFFGQQLEVAENSATSAWRDSTRLPEVISCR